MKLTIRGLLFFSLITFSSCTSNKQEPQPKAKEGQATKAPQKKVPADAAIILSRKEVPILCYHDIRNFKPNERASMKGYIVQVQAFKDQIKMLADSGYQTITPDQYYDYLTYNTPLPPKPIMITFDDSDEEQYTIGAAELNKYGFKGVYFLMTIAIGRPRYMSKEQIRALSDSGHVMAAHTWDHHKVTEYTDADWEKQLTESKKKIESITGKPVQYFAYPFGLWNREAFPQLQKRDIKMAFQLSTKRDSLQPLLTARRMIVHGTWDLKTMQKWMRISFKHG